MKPTLSSQDAWATPRNEPEKPAAGGPLRPPYIRPSPAVEGPANAPALPEAELDVESLFKAFQDDKISALKEIVDDIRDLIAERQHLHKELFLDFEKAKLAIGNQLTDPSLTDEDRTKLRISLIDVDHSRTEEKLNAFRDISDLRKELREHLKEYREKANRLDLLERLV